MERNPLYNYNRLPMEKAYNVRELGGYAARKGRITQYHKFLRSENLTDLTGEDITFLKSYGLKTVIDLRGSEEAVIYPCQLRNMEGIDYINLPFISDNVLDLRTVQDEGFIPEQFYKNLVDYRDMVCKIMKYILDHKKGTLLFHCQAGKDRTGVLAMILLGNCGVSKYDIIANYEVTHTYLKDKVELHIEKGLEELEYSRPAWIEAAYDHIITEYGSFIDYLLTCGMTKKEIKKLRKRLLEA